MSKVFQTAISRKLAMATSAIFLVIFLLVHLSANMLSVISPTAFNTASHFMGTNPLVQYIFQPILMFGVIFHFVMGFVLEIKNKKARGNNAYVKYNGSANSTWMSRNMIISGGFILVFLAIHLLDFWVHEMNYKYIEGLEANPERYYEELVVKFHDLWRVVLYIIGFIFLCLHLLHGFKSSMQSVGLMNIRQKGLITVGKWYSFIVSVGFIFVVLYHYINYIMQ